MVVKPLQTLTEKNGWNERKGSKGILRQAEIICSNWEKVIAEAVFKYAGSVYKDLEKMKDNAKDAKMFGKYVKHWGELKGLRWLLKQEKLIVAR